MRVHTCTLNGTTLLLNDWTTILSLCNRSVICVKIPICVELVYALDVMLDCVKHFFMHLGMLLCGI